MLSDYQSLAQLSVGLNVGFAAFYAYFSDTYFSERRFLDGLQAALKSIEKSDAQIGRTDRQIARRHLDEAERILAKVGLRGVRANYWPFLFSLSAALLAFVLLIDFSVSARADLTPLKSALLTASYLAVVIFAVVPLIRDLKARRLIRDQLMKADDVVSQLLVVEAQG